MYQLDPRPYLRLTPEQRDRVLREVALYLEIMEQYRSGQRGPLATKGEQLELFPSERLDV